MKERVRGNPVRSMNGVALRDNAKADWIFAETALRAEAWLPPQPAAHAPKRTGIAALSWRLLRLGAHLAAGVVLAACVYPRRSEAAQCEMLRNWSRKLLDILGVQLQSIDRPPVLPGRCLLLANHVSWLDVFALSAMFPAVFVAKSEVRRWPLIGKLCARTGNLFIERGSARGARRANREIAQVLQQATRPVAVYPEGTTTDGSELKPFRSALLQPAVDAHAVVQPFALRYSDMQGRPIREVGWVGNATLLDSILTIARRPQIKVEVRFLPSWPAAQYSRGEIASRSQAQIAHALGLSAAATNGNEFLMVR